MIRWLFRRMVLRTLFLPIGFIASVAGPYLYFNPQLRASAWNRVTAWTQSVRSNFGGSQSSYSSADGYTSNVSFSTPKVTPAGTSVSKKAPKIPAGDYVGGPITPLEEVFHPNVNSHWVMQRWPRVSSVLGEMNYEGIRVPLSTGKRRTDLVGSLTYYFDHQGRLKRIQFDGQTADPRALMEYVVKRLNFQHVAMKEGYLFLQNWNGVARGGVKMSRRSVTTDESPWDTYLIEMEYNVPTGDYGLSRRFYNILLNDKLIQRW